MTAGSVLTHLVGWMVLQRPDRSILLARRCGVAYANGLWGLPGGHARRRETWAQAAVRETAEEVGVTVAVEDLAPIGVQRYLDGRFHGVDAFFLAAQWAGEPAAVSECDAVDWFDPTDLPPDVLPWLARSIDTHLLRRVWFDELF